MDRNIKITKKIYMWERIQNLKKKCSGIKEYSVLQTYRIIANILKEWNDDIKLEIIKQLIQDNDFKDNLLKELKK